MTNHIQQLLNQWHPKRDELQWVLATIIATEGSSYRKPGAMMMINSLGSYYGLLSGGCLESDIMRQARKCWDTCQQHTIEYDMRDEGDFAWSLGIGCGGMVRILLQTVTSQNQYLGLMDLREYINDNLSCTYSQNINSAKPENSTKLINQIENGSNGNFSCKDIKANIFIQTIEPPPHIAIFGGGIDAIPVVNIATNMGWQVSLVDPRAGYARESKFSGATRIVKTAIDRIENDDWLQSVDAMVIMTHNVSLDAQALLLAQKTAAKYIGLLGPSHRTDQVLEAANITRCKLTKNLANPIGLKLGGDLPESIALAIVSEIHAFIFKKDAQSISNILSAEVRL